MGEADSPYRTRFVCRTNSPFENCVRIINGPGFTFSKLTDGVTFHVPWKKLGRLMPVFQSIAVALYNMIAKFGLVDTYAGIALPQLVSAFGVYLMREAAEQIPNDYIDAARIDGCGEFHIFRAVVLPQLKPYIATLTVIKFMWVWNEFFWPLIVINSENLKVVTLGLTAFSNMYFTEYHLATAASLLSMLPVLVLFLLFQRWFIQAVSMSGLKG